MFKKESNGKLKFVLVLQVLKKNYFEEIKNYINDNFENNEVIIKMNLNIIYLKNYIKQIFIFFHLIAKYLDLLH